MWHSTDNAAILVKVTGVWGWNEEYANAYDTQMIWQPYHRQRHIHYGANVEGEDLDGFTPRISAGNLFKSVLN